MRVKIALLLLPTLLFALAAVELTRAEVVQKGNLRVAFEGSLAPKKLPRQGVAPVSVVVGGRVTTNNGSAPPQLQRISIAVNRYGRIAPGTVPSCRIDQIQPATTEGALEACRSSLVGRGTFSARVLLPEQAPFPSDGQVYAFNGTYKGHPAILAHVYGTQPVPTSYTLPFRIDRTKGTFGTLLSTSLPSVTTEWGYVTGLSLKLSRTVTRHGAYVTATCPAPRGFTLATFPLARSTFAFAGGVKVTTTLNRTCKVRG